ncbi:SMP-30/gluconolactonase/LRE family protein [Roseibium sp. MMSF_3412]|uniref:SMP-30/gluconolactonase/LRE family protein n=1 Tax=Roseibium sp. MMSF_3412 TaxID=3046712 RepID=UPI00273D4FF6|nr:SMP-30/gluconolactonase/LRE family protein [Roseibium sp. MMSF_3412]
MSNVFDERRCVLGEGPLWHPERQQLFWFDILSKKMMTRENGSAGSWEFDEYVSAAGWVSKSEMVIASASQIFLFNLDTGAKTKLCDLEADDPVTRSNDGRADPKGGFWIGTMGINAEQGKGSIYRFYKGELRRLYSGITISNAICFSPDGQTACFADTATQSIQQVTLDAEGWPNGTPTLFADFSNEDLNPDGAVIDTEGYLWNAQWGANRVARYAPNGDFVDEISFTARQVSCPAFGGADLGTLFATTAAEGLDGNFEGKTYFAQTSAVGQPENRVIL